MATISLDHSQVSQIDENVPRRILHDLVGFGGSWTSLG